MSNKKRETEIIEAVVGTASKDGSDNDHEWITMNGFTFKFRKVAAYFYSDTQLKIKNNMRATYPKPPIVTKGSQSLENPADPEYRRELAIWEAEYEDMATEVGNATTILVGVVLKDPIPEAVKWLPDILDMSKMLGLDLGYIRNNMSHISEDMWLEYLYKKYIVLADDNIVQLFSTYHRRTQRNINASSSEVDAVDMFRS